MKIIPDQSSSVPARVLPFVDHTDPNSTKMVLNLDIEELTRLRKEKK